jgi:hypothetical protein
MTVTIEVATEAGGVSARKRAVLSSDDFGSAEDLESAAVEFIRTARTANEEDLATYDPGSGTVRGE